MAKFRVCFDGEWQGEFDAMDDAIEWGKRIPTVCKGREGCIEIRPIDELQKHP